jgi:hypothetical protein
MGNFKILSVAVVVAFFALYTQVPAKKIHRFYSDLTYSSQVFNS